ncbi:MAG: hypothetical protein LV479_13040 [Methylacidiphilales bacterium]|nr:hypothetical protein [Candidatus Methylacidiphilales bacterium]
MEQDGALPPFGYHGCLPEGVHETTLDQMRERFVINPKRTYLWERLEKFLHWATTTEKFSHAYIDGGFITSKPNPEDIDVILQTRAHYGPEAFGAMEPFFAEGIDTIYEKYSVHLHFWCEGFPGGLSDFRRFFQYLRPQDAAPYGLREGTKKGIVRIKL